MLYTWNQYNIVNQLYFNLKRKKLTETSEKKSKEFLCKNITVNLITV